MAQRMKTMNLKKCHNALKMLEYNTHVWIKTRTWANLLARVNKPACMCHCVLCFFLSENSIKSKKKMFYLFNDTLIVIEPKVLVS